MKINRRWTFDSGATPKDIAGKRPATNLAEVDLDQIRARMQETIERAKAEDPRELQARIRDLERRLREQPKAETKTVEVPVLDEKTLAQLAKLTRSIEDYGSKAADIALELSRQLAAIATRPAGTITVSTPAVKRPEVRAPRRQSVAHSNGNHGDLSGVQLRVLRAVQSLRDRNLPINRVSVARWMGIHPNGGRYNAALRQLKEADLLDADLHPTEKTPAVAPLCADGPDGILDLLDQGKKRVFEEILQYGGVTREELADKLGIHPNGGRFNSHLRWLRDMGVVTERGPIKAVEGVYR